MRWQKGDAIGSNGIEVITEFASGCFPWIKIYTDPASVPTY